MAIGTFPGMLQEGDHAGRPAATAVGSGALYACSDHGLIYQSDGSTWSTWWTGTGVADILDIPTAETDDTLVLAPDGAGGVEFRPESGGGGGSDLVQVASGAGSVRIPGLAGSPDIPAGGGNDSEFDTTSAGVPTGWTASSNAVTAQNTNTTVKSHYYVSAPNAGADKVYGIYKAAPSIPYTVTVKIGDANIKGNFQGAMLAICDATDLNGKATGLLWQHINAAPGPAVTTYTTFVPSGGGNTSGASGVSNVTNHDAYYLRAVVTAAGNVGYYWSRNGQVWASLVTGNAHLATAGTVFIGVLSNGAATEATFDWVRFT